MLEGGFFLNGYGDSSGSSGYEDVYLDNGKIVFSPIDPIYIDDQDNVFFDNENKNSRMYIDGNKIFVVRVV